MERLKIRVCGVGAFSKHFIPLFKAHPLVESVTLCDLDAAKIKDVAEKLGCRRHARRLTNSARAVKSCLAAGLPPNNVWMAARYLVPGLVAHEPALKGGILMEAPDFGNPIGS